ncbi:hypothetical protein B0H16DRAFT_1338941 [Mycena metata]|uniref:Uncharacterized protein n=1 Tax=Mycena metata TaxID=1033252 RepID=A0AAD7MGJ4_9AGAR|nr:hypothetical protein B0H16DRAFT_1338941 [Mycena metata]
MQIVPAVSVEELSEFEQDTREATTAHYFRFDVLGTPNSSWNKSAARVFAKSAIRQLALPNSYEMVQAIKKAFTAHLQRIQIKSLGRRQARKYQVFVQLQRSTSHADAYPQLFHQRRYVAYAFKPLRQHAAMLERLGVDGMSSDDSDQETQDIRDEHQTTYSILTPLWRASHLAAWLRIFDSVHNILRKSGSSSASLGSFTRLRTISQRRSRSKKFVPGLPLDVYDPHWIAQDARRKYDLYPTMEQYDFSHQADIVEYVLKLDSNMYIQSNFTPVGWLFSMVNYKYM